MSKPVKPDRSDYIKSAIYLTLYVAIIGAGAFLLLPELLYLWLIVVIGGLLLLVNWHKEKTEYQCPNCSHTYRISFLTDLFSPHGIDKGGAWLFLRCPNCRKWKKTPVLKADDV